tara:strand:+ start:776 stop:970 length:195 start_codon:yes stop_codon:yes gene_type:complete
MQTELQFLEELEKIKLLSSNDGLQLSYVEGLILKYQEDVDEHERDMQWLEDNEEFVEQTMRLGL